MKHRQLEAYTNLLETSSKLHENFAICCKWQKALNNSLCLYMSSTYALKTNSASRYLHNMIDTIGRWVGWLLVSQLGRQVFGKFDLIDCQKMIAYKSTNLIKIMQGFSEINELYVCKKKIHSVAGNSKGSSVCYI